MEIEYEIKASDLEDLDKKIDEKIKSESISGYTFNGKINIKKGSDKYIVSIGYDPV